MSSQIDISKLAALIKAKKKEKGLRIIAKEIGGVSASTLSRIDQGKVPDLDTFLKICNWLGISPNHFSKENQERKTAKQGTEEIVEAHLRADSTLAPETADALVRMVRLAYDDAKKRSSKK